MLGLELMAVGMLQLADMKVECKPHKAPQINVLPSKSNVTYDFSKSQAELNTFDIDTISPYGPDYTTHVGGLMLGEMQVKHRIGFMHEKYNGLDRGCLYFDTVEVKIHIDPTIYVARDFPEGTCKHRAILEHEKEHVQIDRIVINKYARSIGQAIEEEINRITKTAYSGPYRLNDMARAQKHYEEALNQVIRRETDKMNEERRAKQQELDNLDEYERVARACPNLRR